MRRVLPIRPGHAGRVCAAAAGLALLAGCAEPIITDSDVIRTATEPAYGYDEGGRIQPTSCRADRPSSYSGTPSACARDVVFARQVFNPADLVDPRRPGAAPAGPLGRAAEAYASGTGGTGADATGGVMPGLPQSGRRPVQIMVPATAGMAGY